MKNRSKSSKTILLNNSRIWVFSKKYVHNNSLIINNLPSVFEKEKGYRKTTIPFFLIGFCVRISTTTGPVHN